MTRNSWLVGNYRRNYRLNFLEPLSVSKPPVSAKNSDVYTREQHPDGVEKIKMHKISNLTKWRTMARCVL